MDFEEVRQLLRARPFVPFRVHTSDGKTMEVKHPEMAWITRNALLVARAVADPMQSVSDHYDSVAMLHIVGLEPLVAA